ncbi:GNAT family N-acetyltransferase [Leucobacter sp. 1207-22]|uniref:GNAT family N-acetyltransferase n=1 Tax=Leucobacter sp. 1207-22 TaxID=2604456 RepID=UPI0040649C15
MAATVIDLGFTDAERERIGELYWQAFSRKFRHAFTDADQGLRVMQQLMRADRVLVARIGGEVVGMCGFQLAGAGAIDFTWAALRRVLGRWQAIRALVVCGVLARGEQAQTLVLDGICVAADWRGRQIGTSLLQAANALAAERHMRAVRLTVIDANPRAAALYRREGYRAVSGGSLHGLASVYGFDGYTVMEQEVRG